MRSSNPVMSSLTENSSRQNSGYADVSTRPMTVDDVVTKTGITLGVIIVAAVINFALGMLVSPGIAMALTLVGGIGGFITVLVASFGKKWGSAAVTLIYAVFEGLFVGGFSLMFANVSFQGEGGMAIIGQAIVGTIGVFIGMLIVYKTGAVKVTPKFTKILFGLIAGVAVMALVNFLGAIFFDFNPLRDGGPIAIIFSLVCIVLGALSFLTDFDQADRMIRAGAPSKNAWGVALGLAVTLVWLYTEILRLLSYFQRD
ncbi:Bax inhibitor-1/YccA family protein [Corynebacterium sp. MSK105]|uniref:Bax inhibitor-1/YccA family protein n=1 Tax=unclassified Corynebacterium TaxID=2624378 RepID=UPI00254B8C90|nr:MULTISPECIES: Bax inhibitor-1/YccA family protein [unclassified Corynebacterium]MDK8481992.1 Bax inhibitor-1/YccA family protein [Corynebacterium sp. MSK074]MDK8689576.1 Bax inhibitor-1/YccA family protein [Corynebacterium sp. MSK105]